MHFLELTKYSKRQANKQSKYTKLVTKDTNDSNKSNTSKKALPDNGEYIHQREFKQKENFVQTKLQFKPASNRNISNDTSLQQITVPNNKNEEDQIKKYNDFVSGL